eukprot:gene32558-17277_t
MQDLLSVAALPSESEALKMLPKKDIDWGIRVPRSWVWYDENEEREEQKKDRRKTYPTAGHAHMLNVPQSQKKLDRILDMIRGLHYEEAVTQCQMVPHKAARLLLP